ncbi:MAG: CHC2 zinc finger domain-containing protein [Nitrosopumilus sp.]
MKYKAKFETLLGVLPHPNSEGEVSILCPFHEDTKRSASVNLRRGLFHCMACQQSHNWKSFRIAWTKDFGNDNEPTTHGGKTKAVPDETIRSMHFELMTNHQYVLDRLQEKRGLTIEMITKMQIGWHERTSRVAIPIRDENEVCVNVRLYSFEEVGNQKMISWKAGYGAARLWPLKSLDHEKYVILAEGEMDCLILLSLGLNAITSTGGAKTWKSEWSEVFVGLKVYIAYDCDTAGEEGALKAAKFLAPHVEQVKIVDLDLSKSGEDVTDFFIGYGYGVSDFKDRIKSARIIRSRDEIASTDNGELEYVSLADSLRDKHRGTEVMIPVIVHARRDERIHYPAESLVTCTLDAGKLCKSCPMFSRSGEYNIKVGRTDPLVTEFVARQQYEQTQILRRLAGVPQGCKKVEVLPIEAGTIEEVLLSPEVDTTYSDDDMYLVQKAYYAGLGLDYNASYVIRTRPIAFWKNSKIVQHISDATPSHDTIESFEMTDDVFERLQKFRAAPGKAKAKLGRIARELQDNVTKIWDRLDLHVAMDLVWHSVIEFEFDGNLIRRGWLEACIVGDTRTGKSEISHTLQGFYGLGEIVSGENSSYAGLVGGAVQIDSTWFVKWGRIPLNDRRLIVIDETTGLRQEDIALMSGIRETGVAEITKIESQKARARVRKIWIGNVRPPKRDLSDYDHGCLALMDLIGMPEDIARFDFATSASADEVSSATVNSARENTIPLSFTDRDAADLILWAWSRDRDTIVFEQEALDACYKYAIEMGDYYTSDLPLVLAANQRIKLARVAAAIAARLFSTDDEGELIIVKEEHVDVARWFFDKMYQKESFGYGVLSKEHHRVSQRRNESVRKVSRFLKTRPELVDYLTNARITNKSKLADMVGLTDDEAQEVIRTFTMTSMMEDRGSHGYRITPQLKEIAKKVSVSDYAMEE